MSNAHDLALAMMLASYVTEEPASKTRATVALVKSATVKASKVEAPSVPSDNGRKAEGMPTVSDLPKPGTLTAEQFIAIANGANVSWHWEENPTTRTTPRQGADRDQMIRAIAGYVGYDPTRNFGDQEVFARRKAQQEIMPHLRPVFTKPAMSVAGYIAGMPDERAKRLGDLRGRERLAVDTMLEHEKAASEATTEQDRKVQLALAQVERERLANIRKDLADFR